MIDNLIILNVRIY